MSSNRKRPKVGRPLSELVEALRRHVVVLRDHSEKAFDQGQEAYLGEVVGKLRLLVGERGNTPLLLQLMKVLDLSVPLVLTGAPPTKRPRPQPGAGDTVTLRQYLGRLAYAGKPPTGRRFQLTKGDLIHLWAEQRGAAHEDWEIDEGFFAARESGIFINGNAALAVELRLTSRTVLYVGERVLAQATPALIEAAENRRRKA